MLRLLGTSPMWDKSKGIFEILSNDTSHSLNIAYQFLATVIEIEDVQALILFINYETIQSSKNTQHSISS